MFIIEKLNIEFFYSKQLGAKLLKFYETAKKNVYFYNIFNYVLLHFRWKSPYGSRPPYCPEYRNLPLLPIKLAENIHS